MTRSKLE